MSEPIFGLLPPVTPSPLFLTHALDHGDRAVASLLAQLRDKARFTTLVRIYATLFQELEDVFWDLYTLRRIDTATGIQLDVIGRIVDEPRAGFSDTDYRAILRIKGRVLRSKGTADDLIEISRLMLQATDFLYEESYPASVQVTVFGTPVFSLYLLQRFLHQAKAAGVRLDVVASAPSASAFHYGDEGTDALTGYGAGSYAGMV